MKGKSMNENDYVRKDVYEAEKDNLITAINDTNARIDDMKERISDVKDSVSHSIAFMGVLFCAVQIGLAVILFFLTKN